jgi:hypothetical protein
MRNNDQRCYKPVAWEMCTWPTDGPKQRLPQGKGQAPVHAIAFLAVYVDASDGRTGSFGLARTSPGPLKSLLRQRIRPGWHSSLPGG